MGKINTNNYPNRPVSDYQDDDMFILQDNGGETYTTNVGDIKDLIGEETDPKLALKVDKNGTDRLMTAAEGTKLAGIAAGAQVNVLEGVVVDSVAQPISGKKAFIDLSGKTDLSVIAYTFNSEMGYFKGAYVTYNGKLYEFIQEHTGAWNPSHVREIRASGQYVRTGNGGYNNGDRATCEGYMTKASGNYSHAEGRETQAVGDCTHAEGIGTIANSIYQHVEGKYNVADNESKYIHIIGNGIDANNRNNAFAIDWEGNVEASGEIEDGNGEKISDKTDKVTNATSGHLAGLDSNGNLTDSGVSPTEDVTVEGNPVTFDSPFEQDAKSVVVSVKPIQDLHGYDHPWPAGGGKNKFGLPYKSTTGGNGINVVVNDDSTVRFYGEATGDFYFTFKDSDIPLMLPAGTYTLSAINAIPPNAAVYCLGNPLAGSDNIQITVDSETNFGSYIHIPPTAGAVDFTLKLQLESGSTATSFAPYSNICPISGIDEVEIEVSGKNIWDEQYVAGDISSATGELVPGGYMCSKNFIKVEPNTDYTIWTSKVPTGGYYYYEYDADKNFVYGSNGMPNGSSFTTKANTHYIKFLYGSTYGYPYTNDIVVSKGSEHPTEYEPYKGSTTTIPLPSTLYDADVDVTNGDADEKSGIVDLGDLEWTYLDDGVFLTDISDKKQKTHITMMCESYKSYDGVNNITGTSTAKGYMADGEIASGEGITAIYIKNTNYSDATIFKASLDGIKLCYELATPTTLSLTPTDVELLEGTNVVSTNGEKVAVTYKAGILATLGDIDDLNDKVKTKFDKKDVAKVEGANASKAYSVGDYMLRADGFYRVTANIASGAAITSNNTTKVTVGGELANKVNNDDSRLSDARTPSNNNSLLHTSGNEGYISGTKYFMNGNIAMAVDQFSASNTYEVGSYTVYQGNLYKCTVRHFESDWDSSHFTISNNIIVANGTIAAGTYETIGSDYAENFETLENCPVCRFVTLDGEKIRLAQPNDYILGVTSETPSVIGDSMKQGISVGLLGKLWVEHDGSAEINGYVISGENGIAIKSDKGYRVMAVDGNKCKVLVK